jgi:hypothetical protein
MSKFSNSYRKDPVRQRAGQKAAATRLRRRLHVEQQYFQWRQGRPFGDMPPTALVEQWRADAIAADKETR